MAKKRSDEDQEEGRAGRALSYGATSALAVGVGLFGGPVAAVSAAGMAPAVAEGVLAIVGRLQERRRKKVGYVIELASRTAGLPPEELLQEMETDPMKIKLLESVLTAAAEAEFEGKLIGLAIALVNGASATSEHDVLWETALVAALAELTEDHFRALAFFESSERELGIGESASPLKELHPTQIDTALSAEDVGAWLLAGLERHALVARPVSRTAALKGGPAPWELTPFGLFATARLAEIVAKLASQSDGTVSA
jgi:hypothetical protein